MLTIIHGDDITASRKYFLQVKEATIGAISLDAEKINLTDLTQIFEGGGLFEDSKAIFIEQFISKKAKNAGRAKEKKVSELGSIITYLEKQSAENDVIFWENKELEKGPLNLFKTANIKIFKLPQTMFTFLDNLKPGNGKTLVVLFHQTIASAETEMVFFMLVRQVRLLLALTSSPTPQPENTIDELKRMQPWQKGKLEQQAKLFGQERLRALHHELFTLETGMKTGGLTSPLETAIDFLLIQI